MTDESPTSLLPKAQDDVPANRWLPDTQSALALIAAVGFMALTFFLAISGKTDSDAFKIMVGALISVSLTQVYQWYFGSSKGSTAKDDQRDKTMTKLVDKVVDKPPGQNP
jgi:hypothetical protein